MFYHKMACSLCQGFYIKFKILNQFMMRRGMNIKRGSRFLATEHFFWSVLLQLGSTNEIDQLSLEVCFRLVYTVSNKIHTRKMYQCIKHISKLL